MGKEPEIEKDTIEEEEEESQQQQYFIKNAKCCLFHSLGRLRDLFQKTPKVENLSGNFCHDYMPLEFALVRFTGVTLLANQINDLHEPFENLP